MIGMAETTSRVLQLLGLLQSRRVWTSAQLAERLGVTGRSVRRDIERLRDLGYPVQAGKGRDGGYQLGAGAALPPLLLDSGEAVAMAVALRLAAGGSAAGVGESALRALSKLDQVMPARLRAQVGMVEPRCDAMDDRSLQRLVVQHVGEQKAGKIGLSAHRFLRIGQDAGIDRVFRFEFNDLGRAVTVVRRHVQCSSRAGAAHTSMWRDRWLPRPHL